MNSNSLFCVRESCVIVLQRGGEGYCGGLLMQFVVADTDSKITQMLKRSS